MKHYLPYSDTDDSGNVTGIIGDVVSRMLEELGISRISVSFIGYDSYDMMISALSDKEIDTAFPVGGGLYYSEESGIFQSSPVVSAATELVYRGEYTEETTSCFAVNENNRMQYYFVMTHYPDAEIVFYASIDDCLKAVSEGKAGCTTLNGLRANDILRNSRYSGLALIQTTYDDDRCFGVQIGNAGLLRLLNRGINVLGSDYAQNLAFRYTDQLYSYSVWDMIRNNMALFGGVILGIAALIILFLVRDVRRSRREIRNKENARVELEKANAELAESQAAKQRELEERLALQEELLKQQSRREQQDKMITALASDYRCVYHVDLDHNDAVCYRKDPTDSEQTEEGIHFPYHERFVRYAELCVADSYRDGFLRFIDPEYIRSALSNNLIIAYRYLAQRNGKEYYEMIRIAGVRHAEDRDDHIVHAVGLGLTVIDEEMREEMAKNQALAEALSAAEDANKAKTAFLSNMSHEIRTPMNAIIGLNDIAMNDPTASDKVKEYLSKIGNSAQHLLGIINDILDMSRIESGRMTIKKEEFSFAKALEQVNTIVSGQCRDKGLVYDCRINGQVDDTYVGDAMKLKQVMINILGNAVKFTPEGGTVRFVIEEGPRYDGQATLRFIISDTGIGMSKEFLPRLFDAFSQEDSSSTSRYGSTGLGMPITKSIVELMNGRIEVESEKGKGTVFTVTVTLGESDRKNLRTEEDLVSQDLNVLVIDDDRIALEHAEIILGQVGISCDTAESGWEGVDKVRIRYGRREHYDLILIDWKMPEMDGVDTTRRIREIVGRNTPIIILTSFNWDEIADEAKEAGVDTFVSKPLFADNVMDEFREAFRRKNKALEEKTADLKGRRVLLAEDVKVNAEIIMMVLAMREMEVDLAENGRIAVDLFEAREPGYYDAILMDMRMPEMDGLEATKAIRASDRADAKTIPIIALTANAFDEDVQRSMQAGLNAHLSKPVEPEVLFDTLESLIKD
ncbi:MAG: response regulator [Clostridia bacterium]|nr:response regulator [Clostridia bacterium]